MPGTLTPPQEPSPAMDRKLDATTPFPSSTPIPSIAAPPFPVKAGSPGTVSVSEVSAPLPTVPRLAVCSIDCRVTDAATKRQELLDAFHQTFSLYESLHDCITEEAHYQVADPLRHPLIFYLGHTAAFYINKLVLAKILTHQERVDAKLECLVAVGVDEMSWYDQVCSGTCVLPTNSDRDDLLPRDFPWPTVKVMRDFRARVRTLVDKVIRERIPLQDNTTIGWTHPFWVILMGTEHERIHFETSSVLMRQLPMRYIVAPPTTSIFSMVCQDRCTELPTASKNAAVHPLVSIPAAPLTLGRAIPQTDRKLSPPHADMYGWDNEFGEQHFAEIPAFRAAQTLVSNADFLAFVRDRGYEQRSLWSEEGWRWVQFAKAKHPKFWLAREVEVVFGMSLAFHVLDKLPWDWPVEVNCLEANAYCRWYSQQTRTHTRLPSEEEYQRMLQHSCEGTTLALYGTEAIVGSQQARSLFSTLPIHTANLGGNLALRAFASPSPVQSFPNGPFFSLVGNVWQWTNSVTYPFEKFQVHPLYDDFTEPTFDDRHNILKGGSWISCGNEVNPYSRYAFRRHFFQHAGFRIVQDGSAWEEGQAVQPDFYPRNAVVDVTKGGSGSHGGVSPVAGESSGSPYETDPLVHQYCEFHYGPPAPLAQIENFPVVCARLGETLIRQSPFWRHRQASPSEKLRALDLGCAVGRTTFELAQTFDEVVGVDMSARFIQVGWKMAQGGIRYVVPVEGEITMTRDASLGNEHVPLHGQNGFQLLDQYFGTSIREQKQHEQAQKLVAHGGSTSAMVSDLTKRVSFVQGDAANLPEKLRNFHLIVASNLLDRMFAPRVFLESIQERLLPGGFLILLSPYTWMESFTTKSEWLGGKKVSGESLMTKDGLEIVLAPWFELMPLPRESHTDVYLPPSSVPRPVAGTVGSDAVSPMTSFHIPFMIRETYRKHQLTFSECTLWRKRGTYMNE